MHLEPLEMPKDHSQNREHVAACHATSNPVQSSPVLAWFVAISTLLGSLAALIAAIRS